MSTDPKVHSGNSILVPEVLITKEEYDAAIIQHDASQKLINDYLGQQVKLGNSRWLQFGADKKFYTDDELVYSAEAICRCGAGLAYAKQTGFDNRAWVCSRFLKGIDQTAGEHEKFEFSFYEIKSELQPSAGGRTTRPKPL